MFKTMVDNKGNMSISLIVLFKNVLPTLSLNLWSFHGELVIMHDKYV